MKLREHKFLGTTQSLCPECMEVVPAKIITRGDRVYFQKFCTRHGSREDFVCSDVRWFDRMDFNVPGREPLSYGIEPRRGCPYDCGLCTQHEQHTCVGVLEITDGCNLTCPMCYANSAPGKAALDKHQAFRAIDRLVEVEGRAEILQLSGGEPTIHPEFLSILQYACQQPIDLVMINTNGIRLANDRAMLEAIAQVQSRCQVYLQMDGLSENVHVALRGNSLLKTKLRAIERMGEYAISTTLVMTLQNEVNVGEIGAMIEFARKRSWITGLSLQPATYVGRSIQPESLERRVTFPDLIKEVERQTTGLFRESDFFPVPCAHPNAHTLSYAFRSGEQVVPITRFIEIDQNYDLLANGISLTRAKTREIVDGYLARTLCGESCADRDGMLPATAGKNQTTQKASLNLLEGLPESSSIPNAEFAELAQSFFIRAMAEDLAASDMFRITTTSFMDAYNFDIRQLMKSCVHHVLPSGHIIPFDAYNLFYRDGLLPLPSLTPARTLTKLE